MHTLATRPRAQSGDATRSLAALEGRLARTAPAPLAQIRIDNLRLRTFIGFNDEEKAKQQDVVINLRIDYRLAAGIADDRVDAALNYKTITKRVIEHVEGGRFLLLEKLVTDVLAICSDDARVHFARVRIDKPHALRFADSVSVTLEHHAEATDHSVETHR